MKRLARTRGRFLQSVTVLQRTRDYGKRLMNTGTRVLRSKGAVIGLRHDDTFALSSSFRT